MSVATAVGSVAAINATTPTIAFVPLQGYFPPPLDVAATTVRSPAVRAPVQSPVRQRRQKRRANLYRAEGRRQAQFYSLASRSFLAADPHSDTVILSRQGKSVYGMLLCIYSEVSK